MARMEGQQVLVRAPPSKPDPEPPAPHAQGTCGVQPLMNIKEETHSEMDFSDALRAVKNGKRVRRALWRQLDGRAGAWMELMQAGQLGDVLACAVTGPGTVTTMVLFTGSQWDLLADDWEIL